jgi:glyceraldehyde-3-phosphate dehydrogenase (ferredoxin)
MKYMYFDASTREYRVEEVPLSSDVLGPIDYAVKLHFDVYKSYSGDVFSASNIVLIGRGVFSGSKLFGSHRLVAVFRSPISKGLHVSTIGGVAYSFMRTGLHGLVVHGWSEEPLVLILRGDDEGRVDAWFEVIEWDKLWSIWRDYKGLRGVKALTRFLVDKYFDSVIKLNGRALVVGPAAARTLAGGIFSIGVKRDGSFDPAAMDSAARGGGGTVLLKVHGVVGVVFGGEYSPDKDNPRLSDLELINKITTSISGKKYSELVMKATTKYRFDPKLGTGGTFGVNYIHYRGLLPFMCYNNVYLSKTVRMKVADMIIENLWKPIQRDVFEVKGMKPWGTCGEPCSAVCKKVWRRTKIDYEPSNAVGPFIGVFDAEKVRELIEYVDELGIDAIEAGHIIGWLFDLVYRGLLTPDELGLERRPLFDPLILDPVRASEVNSILAKRILEGLVEHRNWIYELIASKGLREAAQELNKRLSDRVRLFGLSYNDLLVYAAHGDKGYMTPNYYWSPGMVAPVPILGRYWTVYSPSFGEPEDTAEAAVVRARLEYLIDNAGVCRFHRGWAERILEELYKEIWGIEVDLVKHANNTLRKILEYQEKAGAEPRPWESKKTFDMVAGIAAETGFEEWAMRIASYGEEGLEWWRRFYSKVRSMLES